MQKITLWIHIGMPKTGTTALQDTLYAQRGILNKHGYCYPELDSPQHFPLVRALSHYVGSPAKFPPQGSHDTLDGMVSSIKKEADKSGAKDVILSSEFFFDYPGLTPNRGDYPIQQAIPYLRGVCETLREKFKECDFRIVTWLRRQDDWLMSMYNNVIKSWGWFEDFDTFFKIQIAPWYGTILSQWGDVFGDENVRVFIYDSRTQDIVKAFLQYIRFPAPERIEKHFSGDRDGNIGLPRDLMYIKRYFNKVTLRKTPLNRSTPETRLVFTEIEDYFFAAARDQHFWKNNHPILSPRERSDILSMFASENEIVLTRFKPHGGPSLFDNNLPNEADWVPYSGPDANIMMEIYAEMIVKMMRKMNKIVSHSSRK